jgi:membrane protease YdiL (CAAX protease family)
MNDLIASLVRVLPFVILLLVIRIRVKQGKFTKEDLGLRLPASNSKFLIWSLVFLCFIMLTEIFLYRYELLESNPWRHNAINTAIRILGMVVLAPVAEELLFRGIFLNKLMQWKLQKPAAVAVQAIVFVAVHSFAYENTVSSNVGIVQSLVDATLYAYARFSTQSIYTPIAMHATGNLIATLERFIL